MKYYVNLVQRGIQSPTHPVSGISGKNYGTATASPPHGGVLFKMSMEEYMANMHDLVGNTKAGQQWVPEFVPEPAEAKHQERCSIPAGCKKPATYIWDRHLFCAEHAPNNAVSLIDGSVKKEEFAPPAQTQDSAPALATVDTKRIEEPGDLPKMQFAPPPVGAEDVEAATRPPEARSPEVQTQPAPAPAVHPEPAPTPAVASASVEAGPSPAPPSKPAIPSAVKTLVEAVTKGVLESIMPAINERLAAIEKKAPAKSPPRKRGHSGKPDLAPSAFQVLRQKAAGMGINTFGKGKTQLEKEIAEKEMPI